MPISVTLIVLLAAVLHAAWNGMVKAGSDRLLDTAVILLGAAVISAVVLPFLPVPVRASWPYLAVSGAIHVVYFALIASSYHRGEMSLVYPITRGTAPALAAASTALFLRQHSSPAGWAGVALVSAGVIMFAFDRRRGTALHAVPIALALMNAMVIAVYTLVDGTGVRLSGNALSYTCWGFIACALGFLTLVFALRGRKAVSHWSREWRRGIVGGAFTLSAYSMVLWAMTRAPIASVAALRETAIVFGVVFAAFKLKETVTTVRVMACLLVFVGAIAIKIS